MRPAHSVILRIDGREKFVSAASDSLLVAVGKTYVRRAALRNEKFISDAAVGVLPITFESALDRLYRAINEAEAFAGNRLERKT